MKLMKLLSRRRFTRDLLNYERADWAGAGARLRGNPELQAVYNSFVELELELARQVNPDQILSPLERKISSSFQDLKDFFGYEMEEVRPAPERAPRVAVGLAVAAALLAVVILPSEVQKDEAVVMSRGASGIWVRPFCMEIGDSRKVLDSFSAVIGTDLAECPGDLALTLAYRRVPGTPGYFGALAFDGDDEPIWMRPTPEEKNYELKALEVSREVSTAHGPVLLENNYGVGSYRIVWAFCWEPIDFKEWESMAQEGMEGFREALDLTRGCETGAFIFNIYEGEQP